jgi:hypothetical protein
LVQRRDGKRSVASEVLRNVPVTVSLDHRRQNPPPELGAGVVSRAAAWPV